MKLTPLPWVALLLAILLCGCGSENDRDEVTRQEAMETDDLSTSEQGIAVSPPTSGAAGAANSEPIVVALPVNISESLTVNSRVASIEGSLLVDLLSRDALPTQLIPSIEGAWQQKCTQGKDGASYNSRVIYQDGKVTLYAHNYSDSQCQNTLARIQMSGRYSVGKATQLDSGELVNLLAQSINTIKAAYYGDVVIQASNDLELCGLSNWSHGELQDVSHCEAFNITAQENNIVKIASQQLVYGDALSRASDGYPTKLEEDVLFYKAPSQLEGNWLQDCKVVGQSGQSRYLEVVGNFMLEQWTLFGDASCDNKLLSQINAYQIDLGNERILASGESVTEIHSQLFSSELALHTVEISEYFNHSDSSLNCGVNLWAQDEYKDVLECQNVQIIFPANTKKIFKLVGDEMTFGDDVFIGEDGFANQLEGQVFIRQ